MTDRPWVADPTVSWTIALTARLSRPTTLPAIESRVGRLPVPTRIIDAGTEPLLSLVTQAGPSGVQVAVSGSDLALGADHAYCDGLGLLAALTALTGIEATSSARGLGSRPLRTTGRTATLERLREVLLAPPATVAGTSPEDQPGDSFARFTVAGSVGVADLAHAAVRAVLDHNRSHGARDSRVAVAIGASRAGGAAPVFADNSALLRLRGVERLSPDDLRAAIRAASPEPSPPGAGETAGAGARVLASATTLALRVLSPRLGSTLLVSHLGQVSAPGVEDLAFYPVTGGGSGISVGAVGVQGSTVVTVRGRRRRHGARALASLASRVHAELSP